MVYFRKEEQAHVALEHQSSSIFDPLGIMAPVLLEGKAILLELCRQNVGWDNPVPTEIQKRWLKWKSDLEDLKNVEIS